MKLAFSPELSLPLDAATQTFAFLARKRAGKTYAAGKLCELLMDAGVQVVILDTVGNWYGLRLAANGKDTGFDIPVIGGLRGDVPLEASAGALIADVVADTGRSLIIDASQLSKGDRRKFATAFGERLWARKKADPSPIHLVLEECQLIVPQRVMGEDARMVGIYEEIVRLGGNYGIGVSMISQRPQSVNKEVLTQTECLVVLQTNGVPEKKAIKEWIVDKGLDVDFLQELPSLPRGVAYVWSPQWLGVLKKVPIGEKRTFDASATPKVGEKRTAKKLAPLDLGDLTERMKGLVERAAADNPVELRKKIAALERDLRDAQVKRVTDVKIGPVQIKEVPVIGPKEVERLERLFGKLDEIRDRMAQAQQAVVSEVGNLKTELSRAIQATARATMAARPTPTPAKVPARAPVPRPESDGTINPPSQRILDALSWLESVGVVGIDRVRLAYFADASPKSSAYKDNVSKLRAAGLIDYRGEDVVLTNEGRGRATPVSTPPTTDDLHNALRQKLTQAQWRILEAAIQCYPNPCSKEELAERAGASPKSSAYKDNVSTLKGLGFLGYPDAGSVVGTELLFLDGSR